MIILWFSYFDTNLLQNDVEGKLLQVASAKYVKRTYVDSVVNLTETKILIKTITALSQFKTLLKSKDYL